MKQKKLALAVASLAICNVAAAEDIPVYQGNEMVVTATRFPQQQPAVPANVIVISRKDIQQSSATSLPELISQLTGAHAFSTNGTTSTEAVDLRGFGMTAAQNTVVVVDGQRITNLDQSTPSWSSIPLSAIQRIEVMRGSGAVLYGEGASGGVINIITKAPANSNSGSVQASAGSYRTRDLQVQGNLAGQGARLRINAEDYASDHYRENNREKLKAMDGDLRVAAGNGDVYVKFGADHQDLRLPGYRRVDPSKGVNEFATDPRGASSPNDYSTRDDGHLSIGLDQQTSLGDLAGELSYRQKRTTADFVSWSSYLESNLNVLSLTPRLKRQYNVFGHSGTLVTGIDLANWDYNSPRSDSPADIASPSAKVQATQRNQAFYASTTTNLDASTVLTAGARLEHVGFDASDVVNPAATGSRSFTPHADELGVRRQVTPSVSVYGKIGQSFRIANVDDIFNQGAPAYGVPSSIGILSPQTSNDRQAGIDYMQGGTTVHADLYQMDLDNEIHYNALTGTNMNLSPTRRYGLELFAKQTLGPKLSVYGNYTYTVAKFRQGIYHDVSVNSDVNVAGNDIPMVPRHIANIGASWAFTPATRLSSNVQYVGKQRFDNDQSNTFQKMPYYTVVDLKLVHETKQWTTALAINNLFNRHYFAYGIRSTFSPGVYEVYPTDGRNLMATATYRF